MTYTQFLDDCYLKESESILKRAVFNGLINFAQYRTGMKFLECETLGICY